MKNRKQIDSQLKLLLWLALNLFLNLQSRLGVLWLFIALLPLAGKIHWSFTRIAQ